MSNTKSILNNVGIAKNGESILAVGFDADGNWIIPQVVPNVPYGTIQIGAEIIHTKDTYDGDDPHILAFFEREKDDPFYGVLYNADTEEVIKRAYELRDIIYKPYDTFIENQHQTSVLQTIVQTLALGTSHLPLDEAREVIEDVYKGFDMEPIEANYINLLTRTAMESSRDSTQMYFMLYRTEDNGPWWHDFIKTPTVETVSAGAKLSPISLSTIINMVFPIPDNFVGEFYVIEVNRWTGQAVKYGSSVTVNKFIKVKTHTRKE